MRVTSRATAWHKRKAPESANRTQALSNLYLCGAERDRTVDLLNAIQALSQLSYSPDVSSLRADAPDVNCGHGRVATH